jgi:hypothetical protein
MADAVENFWPDFGKEGKFIEIHCDTSNNLAYDAITSYNIPCKSSNIGSGLSSIDIKHMDVMNVVKLSLLQYGAENGGIYEAIVNPDGEVEFIKIGEASPRITDVYYSLQSLQYKEVCNGVLVTGGKPLAERLPIDWKLIWEGSDKEIFDTHFMHSNCTKDSFNTHATIVFNDPHLDSSFEDGIDNLYEISVDENPFAKILGYAYYKDVPENLIGRDTSIKYSDTEAIVPIMVAANTTDGPDIGTLQRVPTYDTSEDKNCFVNLGSIADFKNGIAINIPDHLRFETVRNTSIDKFMKVSSVYVVGSDISNLRSVPKTHSDSLSATPSEDGYNVLAYIDTPLTHVTKLEEGKHYAIAYDEESGNKTPYLVFANNIRTGDVHNYGNCVFHINPYCPYFEEYQKETERGTILPTSHSQGILVQEVWASIHLNTPSIVVYDPDGQNSKALTIATNLNYYIGAMMMEDKPAPMAFNGSLLDQVSSKQDHDPTTSQRLQDTDYEAAIDRMDGGGGLSLTLSFLDGDGDYDESEDQVKRLSSELFELMNSGTGVQTTYICGPECDPQIGAKGLSGGIINSITYSYSDSNSYMISVTEGPYLVGGLSQINGAVIMKAAEDVGANGTIIQDLGNHIHYKVHIDEFGDRIAINAQHAIIRVGDKVSCAIHNCPVEM